MENEKAGMRKLFILFLFYTEEDKGFKYISSSLFSFIQQGSIKFVKSVYDATKYLYFK